MHLKQNGIGIRKLWKFTFIKLRKDNLRHPFEVSTLFAFRKHSCVTFQVLFLSFQAVFKACLPTYIHVSPLSQMLQTSNKLLWIVLEKLFPLPRKNMAVNAYISMQYGCSYSSNVAVVVIIYDIWLGQNLQNTKLIKFFFCRRRHYVFARIYTIQPTATRCSVNSIPFKYLT